MIASYRKQLHDCRNRTKHILSQIPQERWFEFPKDLHTNIAWQVGHLSISEYYSAVRPIVGTKKELYDWYPMKEFAGAYGFRSKATDQASAPYLQDALMDMLDRMHDFSMEQIATQTDDNLSDPIVKEHPMATNKEDALAWTIQHEMWHQGQIVLISRMMGLQINPFPPR